MSKNQSYELDKQAVTYGLSLVDLMDQAGKRASQWLLKQFSSCFQILCGPGNNGGDGWLTAFYLKKAGQRVYVFCSSKKPLALAQKKQAQALNIPVQKLSEYRPLKGAILVDALFGVGLNRKLNKEYCSLIAKVNRSGGQIVALDLPSGLCGDTGKLFASAIKATYTLSFALAKPGFYLNEGPRLCGKIVVLPLGFPKKLLKEICHSLKLVQKKDVLKFLPIYKRTANKSHRGRALIVAGRPGLWGAGFLASKSAYTVGSGYVTWASKSYPYEKSLQIPSALLGLLKDKKLLDQQKAIGVGPGLGFSKAVEKFILKLKQKNFPTVLDADALTLLAKKNLGPFNKNFILTPHSGELARLINKTAFAIEKNRILSAQKGASKYNSWLLLKGFYPVLSDGENSWIIPFGNSALAKAGSGDVLTGIITGLLAQGLSLFKGACLGTVLLGMTAQQWLKEGRDVNSFSAEEIIQSLPFIMKKLRLG